MILKFGPVFPNLWRFVDFSIRNIATNVASMYIPIVFDCLDVIIICRQLWSQEQPYMKFWASFHQIYGFQQVKLIRKLTIRIGLACWNRKIEEKLAHKFHVKLLLCFCRKSCPHLGRWLNANLNGQFVIAIWRNISLSTFWTFYSIAHFHWL